ncbi:hypothetical protein U1Q18_031387, partial [Sarracenia purpurea var. burkii]
ADKAGKTFGKTIAINHRPPAPKPTIAASKMLKAAKPTAARCTQKTANKIYIKQLQQKRLQSLSLLYRSWITAQLRGNCCGNCCKPTTPSAANQATAARSFSREGDEQTSHWTESMTTATTNKLLQLTGKTKETEATNRI